jgi:hypothetical protein
MRRLTLGLALLRATGIAALMLLLWNPVASRAVSGRDQPLVLLDASLSMTGHGGTWRTALDTARALARGGVIWRFGDRVAAFDSTPPTDGSSLLAPALAAAAARSGPSVVVTDGEIADRGALPADLLRSARLVVLRRPAFFDAFVAGIEGPRRVETSDTIRLRVSYGLAGERGARSGKRGTLVVSAGGRRLASQPVALPDSGLLSADVTLPATRFPLPGWTALDVRLDGVPDSEPRDDGQTFVLEVSPQPAAVLLASPPSWESRFLARALGDVARVPLRVYAQTEPGRWRDAATLAPVPVATVRRAAQQARLVAELGDPAALADIPTPGALLVWPTTGGRDGDWYVDPPPASPLAGYLAGIFWDSLPPASAVADLPADSAAVPVLQARLTRRGASRPVAVLSERRGQRRATIAATGLWRWGFRGGASDVAYRTLIGALTDWLLGGGDGRGERFAPLTYEVANGLPLLWRWTGKSGPQDVPLTLTGAGGARSDTLRFDATGRAELRLPPGAYRYAAQGGSERGLVAADVYSDEWRPSATTLSAQPGVSGGRRESVALRDRWWLFVLAVAAFAAEWAWRRRQGLP